MKVFFAGIPFGLGGPREVNKNMIEALGDRVVSLQSSNKFVHVFEMIYKILMSDVIVFSGVSAYDYVFARIVTILHKNVVYIMHGCNELENRINRCSNPMCEKSQLALMRCAHCILCVSKTHRDMMRKYYPHYAYKIDELTNGVNWLYLTDEVGDCTNDERDHERIVLMGGGRITKRNLNVCLAVDQLNEELHWGISVDVYGSMRDSDDSHEIAEVKCVNFMGMVPHKELLLRLKGAQLFVQNSEFESFSLGVVEALMCGCDLLVSQFVGAKDIIDLQASDVICNPNDIEEIRLKIENVLLHGNNKRLLSSIDRDSTSIYKVADRLLEKIETYFV